MEKESHDPSGYHAGAFVSSIATLMTSKLVVNPVIFVLNLSMKLFLALFILVFAGCRSPVPANEAKFGNITFRFPLDADITGLKLTVTGKNKMTLDATRWRSKNAPDVIKNSYEGEAILIEATGNVAAKVGAAVVEGAVKGAK